MATTMTRIPGRKSATASEGDGLAVRLRGVVKRYGQITAVAGLDLDVPTGTCVGLLGPNGAGKSTTMKTLTAQAIADAGRDEARAARFLREVDSAIVVHNASTQFADGGEFGFGGEIGIATGRMHARGPVGLEQLTSFKYRNHGRGQVRP